MIYDEPNESKVGPEARTLDSLPPVDSDPGSNRIARMNLKSPPGQDFRLIGSLRFRPWSESNESHASKLGPKARTSEPFDSCGASEAFDAEATEAGVGGSESDVLAPR